MTSSRTNAIKGYHVSRANSMPMATTLHPTHQLAKHTMDVGRLSNLSKMHILRIILCREALSEGVCLTMGEPKCLLIDVCL